MQNNQIENAIIVKSKTRLEQLIGRFNTQAQAKFYITQNQAKFMESQQVLNEKKYMNRTVPSQSSLDPENLEKQKSGIKKFSVERNILHPITSDFGEYEAEHEQFHSVLESIQKKISGLLKVKVLEREYLPSYIFTEKDLVIVVGQDGLVANAAKYVNDLPIVAVNPDPSMYDGVLLPYTEKTVLHAVGTVLDGTCGFTNITMARTELNDGQRLLAFNDFFIGINNHTSARYRITWDGASENHSSSGIIVSTGAGSSGWLSSLYNMAKGINRFITGADYIKTVPLEKDAEALLFIVREPFASKSSQAGIIAGRINPGQELIIESRMPTSGVIFSDGILSDFLEFNSGAIATIGIAPQKARLVTL
jgi:NAD kinase